MVAFFRTSGTSPSHDLAREALGDGRLADAGIADEQRVVLLAAAEDLDGALTSLLAADQGIDPALARLLVEVRRSRRSSASGLLLASSPRLARLLVVRRRARACGSDMPARLAMPWLM